LSQARQIIAKLALKPGIFSSFTFDPNAAAAIYIVIPLSPIAPIDTAIMNIYCPASAMTQRRVASATCFLYSLNA
jgi:hypothetical protein